ncbi:hypothetical protein R55210_AODCCCNP_01367 [Fructobacillus fructosus]|nr:hypothetical protein R55210_AODCCCNP_01367 [Fructobacillus fructosus]
MGTGSLLKNDEQVPGDIPRVSVKTTENGILGFYDTKNNKNARHFKNVISVNFFGNAFYHPGKVSFDMKVHALQLPNHVFNKETGLYFTSLFNHCFNGQYSYGNQLSSSKLKKNDFEIEIPCYPDDTIAFDYIETLMSELELDRIKKLESYLNETGLNDYTLTQKEEDVILSFRQGKVKLSDFRMEDVFDWQPQKEINPRKLEELYDENSNVNPFYGQSTTNNGIISYEKLVGKVLNNTASKSTLLIHSNNQNVVYLDSPFYLKDGHGATSVIQSKNMNKLNSLFMMAIISRSVTKQFDYNNKATKIALKNMKIQLPVMNDGAIDYETMSTYAKAIEKLVIKNVVLWKDKYLNTAML